MIIAIIINISDIDTVTCYNIKIWTNLSPQVFLQLLALVLLARINVLTI
jgi:hypothetical protein